MSGILNDISSSGIKNGFYFWDLTFLIDFFQWHKEWVLVLGLELSNWVIASTVYD